MNLKTLFERATINGISNNSLAVAEEGFMTGLAC